MLNKITAVLLGSVALLLGACDIQSDLPEASGKASVRAINAIPSSGEIVFLIEERSIAPVSYKSSSTTVRYDDLAYTFNFEVFFAGETSLRRVASRNIDFVAGKDYTMLLSGQLASPTITLWETDERTFTETDTVFEARFAHAATSLGSVDYYYDAPDIAPVLGNQVATLSFGEVSVPVDYAEGTYVLTITAAGDPDTVLYVSSSTFIDGQSALFFTAFDGDANDTAPVTVRAVAAQGQSLSLPDPNYPPTIQFINASQDLGTVDIYSDETLTSRVVADHAYRDVTEEAETAGGGTGLYYTPAGDTAAVLLETAFAAFDGSRYRVVATGSADNFGAVVSIPNRAPELTRARLLPFHASNNFSFLDVYAVPAGESVDENNALRSLLPPYEITEASSLVAGSYDIYVTEYQNKIVLAGPYRVDVALGDIVDMIIVDTEDPAVLDVLFLGGGPAS